MVDRIVGSSVHVEVGEDLILREDQTFDNERVLIDGHAFRDCDFVNCHIVYGGGSFELTNVGIDACSFAITGAAVRTMKYLALIHRDQWNAGHRYTFTQMMIERMLGLPGGSTK